MRLPFLALGALLASTGLAQNLSSPRIQVVRVGNGTDALSPMGNPVFIEEYKTLVGSEVISSTMLPTSEGLVIPGSDGLAGGGSSTFRGLFNVVGGYETSVTSGTLSASVPAVVNRSVGLFGFDRYFEPTFFTDGFENGMVTGAVSDGIDRVFLSGRGTAAGLRMGLRGLTQNSTSIYSGNPDINRVRYAYSGDIMATSFNSGGIGAGIHEYDYPVNSPQTPDLKLAMDNAFDVYDDNPDVMFIATRGTSDNDETSRGIQRWQYNSMLAKWEFHYVIRTGLEEGETVVSLEYDGENLYCVTGDANGTTENNRLLAINPTNDFNNDNLCDNGFVEIAQAGTNRKFTSVMLPPMPSIVAAEYAPRLNATCLAYRERGLGIGNIRVGLNRNGSPFNWTETNDELDFEGNVADFTANKYGTGSILMTFPTSAFTGIGFVVARTPYRTSNDIEFSDAEQGPAGYEPRAIAVTENGIMGVLLVNGNSAMVQTFNPDLSTAALHDNGGAGFTVSGQTPINIAPRGNASFAVLFGGADKGAFISLNAATGASTPSGSYTIPSGGAGITMTPLDIRFDTSLRAIFLNVGMEPNQNLFRLDSAPAGVRTFTPGTPYRRDEVGVGGEDSPGYRQRAIGLTMNGDTPMVTMMGLFGGDATLFEPADDQQIPGSGKVWTMGGPNYSYTKSSFRMAPGYAPLDFPF